MESMEKVLGREVSLGESVSSFLPEDPATVGKL